MIVGTAGHIDHGKTALLKALTGTNTDRLPEEKARGITLDLGFAYQHFEGAPSLSFLDVPGHDKLIHNMLAGATGIDFVILVVAADDGVMPQTREHLAVIDLIGVNRGVIALTKIDRVATGRVVDVEGQIRALIAGTTLEGAPIQPCSAVTGAGIAKLSRHLAEAARAKVARRASGHFRLAVDRVFTLEGAGLVITGTVYSGSVKTGDKLLHSPVGTEVRVRGVRAENRKAENASAGQRCALNIAGRKVDKYSIKRGDWILASEIHSPTQKLDVRLRLLREERRALKHWTPVHVHLGTCDVTGRVGLLEDKALEPGATSLARLILDRPIGGLYGDRFVVRDQSAMRTIGGGHVIDPFPPARGTRTPSRLQALALMDQQAPGDALAKLISATPNGIDLKHFQLVRNLPAAEAAGLWRQACLVEINSGPAVIGLSPAAWTALKAETVGYLAQYQMLNPDSAGATIFELMRAFKELKLRVLAREALTALIEDGAVLRYGQFVHLPGHEVKLSDGEEALWLQIEAELRMAGFNQPRTAALAAKIELAPEVLGPLLSKLGRIGRLRRVSKAYFMLPDVVATLAAEARRTAEEHPKKLLTVGRYRELTKISRHMIMPLLEFFDKVGFTQRLKDGRQIRSEWAE